MNIRKGPEQIKDLQKKIKECIEQERYIQSTHAIDRELEKEIELPDALHVLKLDITKKVKRSLIKHIILGNMLSEETPLGG